MRLSIHVVTKGRNDLLLLLLESIRKQTHTEWDLIILDNNSGNEQRVPQNFALQAMLARLQFEGHRVTVLDNSADTGPRDIGRYRNLIIEKDPFAVIEGGKYESQRTNTIGVRIDDDSVCELNYLEIIAAGFTAPNIAIVGGICPYFFSASQHAPIPAKFNEVFKWSNTAGDFWTDNCVYFYRMLDEKGNDRHWSTTYYESGHIRSNYAYRIDVARKIRFPEYTGSSGFTEESCFNFKAWMSGYRILINPNAIAWHLAAPYGGGRDLVTTQEQADKIKQENFAKLKEDLTAFRLKLGIEERGYP